MATNRLDRQITVLEVHRVSSRDELVEFIDPEADAPYARTHDLRYQDWVDMGRPAKVTVATWAGDHASNEDFVAAVDVATDLTT